MDTVEEGGADPDPATELTPAAAAATEAPPAPPCFPPPAFPAPSPPPPAEDGRLIASSCGPVPESCRTGGTVIYCLLPDVPRGPRRHNMAAASLYRLSAPAIGRYVKD